MNNSCPTCGAVYNVAAKDIGRKIKCKKCNTALAVSEAGLVVDDGSATAAPVSAGRGRPTPAEPDDAFPTDDDIDDGSKRGRRRSQRGGGGPNLGELLGRVGGLPTVVFGFGAFLVIVFLFMPIIGAAAVQRAKTAKEKLELEQESKIRANLPSGKSAAQLEGEERTNYEKKAADVRKEFNRKIEDAAMDAEAERISNIRAVWFERYGMMFGFIVLMVGSLALMMPDQPQIKRVMGVIVATAQMVLVFIAFVIRGAA